LNAASGSPRRSGGELAVAERQPPLEETGVDEPAGKVLAVAALLLHLEVRRRGRLGLQLALLGGFDRLAPSGDRLRVELALDPDHQLLLSWRPWPRSRSSAT
jgi:hypothetical protein